MIGCCACTKSGCYQDKEAVEYYVGGGARVSQDFDAKRAVNGSDGDFDSARGLRNPNGVASDEARDQQFVADGKLIR